MNELAFKTKSLLRFLLCSIALALSACGGGEIVEGANSSIVALRKTDNEKLGVVSNAVVAPARVRQVISQAAPVAGNLVSNPGFESGASNWVQSSSGGYNLISAFSQQTANTGSQIAWLGGYDNGQDTLSQDLLVSGSGLQAKLQFWYKISTAEVTTTKAYDTFAVELYSTTSGTKLATLATFSNLDATTGWQKSPQYDVSAYIGQRIRIQFTASLDESETSSLLIDDVSLAMRDFSTVSPQNGWWWNPAEGGRGFAIERQGDQIFLAAFLYEANGPATWYVATLAKQGNGSYVGNLLRYSGGQSLLGAYKSPGAPSTVAVANLTFDNAASGTLDIQQADGSTLRSIAIERFPISTPTFTSSNANFESGWWWNEAQGGRGFFVEVQGTQAFIGGFMYDSAGQPVWYVSNATLQSAQSVGGPLQQYESGQTLGGSYKSPTVVSNAIGNITFNFSSAATGSMTLPNGNTVAMKRYIFNTAATTLPSGGTANPPATLASFAGTYTVTTSGLTVTFVVDANGNITRCTSGKLLVCSGSVNSSGVFNMQGNDGASPVDTTATATGTIGSNGGVAGTYFGNSVSDGAFSGSFTGTRINVSSSAAPSYQTAFDTCFLGTPDLYTQIYCNAYANAMVAGSTPQSANQAGANAAGSNVGNVGTGQTVSSVGTPNNGGTTNTVCLAPKISYNNVCVVPQPSLSFNKASLTYSPQANGTTSAAQTVTLTNTGNTGILLKSSLTLPIFARWAIVNNSCPNSGTVFPAGASCVISINFTPSGDDNKLAAYLLQQSLGYNPSPIPNDSYTGTYEVWGDSVTNPQLPVPKATVLLNASGVYPSSPVCAAPQFLQNGACVTPTPYTGKWVGSWQWSGPTYDGCPGVDGGTFSLTLTQSGTTVSGTTKGSGVNSYNSSTCKYTSTENAASGTFTGTVVTGGMNIEFSLSSMNFSGRATSGGTSSNGMSTSTLTGTFVRTTGGQGTFTVTKQ